MVNLSKFFGKNRNPPNYEQISRKHQTEEICLRCIRTRFYFFGGMHERDSFARSRCENLKLFVRQQKHGSRLVAAPLLPQPALRHVRRGRDGGGQGPQLRGHRDVVHHHLQVDAQASAAAGQRPARLVGLRQPDVRRGGRHAQLACPLPKLLTRPLFPCVVMFLHCCQIVIGAILISRFFLLLLVHFLCFIYLFSLS